MRTAAGVLATALLSGLYARGGAGWVLGFVALVPWLRALDATRSLRHALLGAWVLSVAFTAAVFAWFGSAIGSFTHVGPAAGLLVLLVAAPLFQPQFLVFALVRHLAGRHHGAAWRALASAAAWVAAEAFIPKLFGDTLGHGLYPSRLLRQAADLGGGAGLTLVLLLANEALAAARARRGGGWRAIAPRLAAAALVPLLLAGYGLAALHGEQPDTGKALRVGLVQANIVDYERLRAERGAAAVVRDVLDTHFAMSYDAVEHQHVDAVLWSETVYPTTFGHPKSEAGAELDREILGIVDAAGVPFVFGTYDRDRSGEYNAAAFVAPGTGLVGFYRKTRVFPLTEYVPPWLDGPTLRRWLPWTGTWQPGSGARVFPLRLRDGREVPVMPLICLDDTDMRLAIDGARLGAQAILTMSNDAWFTDHPEGAALHQTAAAFRSIETRLPQFRVTTNGYSAVIDPSGTIVAGSRMDERTLVIGALPVPQPPRTLVVRWGDWVGRAAAVLLALWGVGVVLHRWALHGAEEAAARRPPLPAVVAVLPPVARMAAGALRVFSRGSLLWMIGAVLLGDGALHNNTLAQIRTFTALFLAPEAAAWCVMRAFAAHASTDGGALVLARGKSRLVLALDAVARVEPWRLPIPCPGATLRLSSGEPWRYGLAHPDPVALARVLSPPGRPTAAPAGGGAARLADYLQARVATPTGRAMAPLVKFVLFPLALALPAFRLHEHIAYGSGFGEYYTFGLKAYLTTFALWWAAWVIGVVLCAAALRTAVEAGTIVAAALCPGQAADARRWLERLALLALYLGLPAWLLLRFLAG